MTTPRAIETTYKGVKFRSRAEARWAVFFDYLGIEWRYEYEGYELPSGRYVPDFWLPRMAHGSFLEVKGEYPTEHEIKLCAELGKQLDRFVSIAWGEMGVWTKRDYLEAHADRGGMFDAGSGVSLYPSRCGKKDCGLVDFIYKGYGEILCPKHWMVPGEPDSIQYTLHNTQKMMAAYEAAYSYRLWEPSGVRR